MRPPIRPLASLVCLSIVFTLAGCSGVTPPKGFVEIDAPHGETKAVAADESLFWSRHFSVPTDGDLDFWLEALKNEFTDQRGYAKLDERSVQVSGKPGVEFVVDATAGGRARRYLLVVWLEAGIFADEIHVVESLSDADRFDAHADAVRAAVGVTVAAASGR